MYRVVLVRFARRRVRRHRKVDSDIGWDKRVRNGEQDQKVTFCVSISSSQNLGRVVPRRYVFIIEMFTRERCMKAIDTGGSRFPDLIWG